MTANDNKTYVTKEGLKQMEEDLVRLESEERKKIADKIQEAKELGDLSENAEYAAAKEEQAFLEMKIAELNNSIKNAVVISEDKNNTGVVNVGSVVTFEDESGNVKEYRIVGSHEADPSQGKISNESPIGYAFIGKKMGDTVEFQAPKGLLKYTIIDVK